VLQPLSRPVFRRFGRVRFAEGHRLSLSPVEGGGLHHPGAGFGMHQTHLDLHGSHSLDLRFLE
jgi:hypothetical protein